MADIPAFIPMKTLLGYSPGEVDRNSRRLYLPMESMIERNAVRISKMGQEWGDIDEAKLTEAARLLNELWEKFNP